VRFDALLGDEPLGLLGLARHRRAEFPYARYAVRMRSRYPSPEIVTLDRSIFSEHVARLPETLMQLIFAGIDVVLGR